MRLGTTYILEDGHVVGLAWAGPCLQRSRHGLFVPPCPMASSAPMWSSLGARGRQGAAAGELPTSLPASTEEGLRQHTGDPGNCLLATPWHTRPGTPSTQTRAPSLSSLKHTLPTLPSAGLRVLTEAQSRCTPPPRGPTQRTPGDPRPPQPLQERLCWHLMSGYLLTRARPPGTAERGP